MMATFHYQHPRKQRCFVDRGSSRNRQIVLQSKPKMTHVKSLLDFRDVHRFSENTKCAPEIWDWFFCWKWVKGLVRVTMRGSPNTKIKRLTNFQLILSSQKFVWRPAFCGFWSGMSSWFGLYLISWHNTKNIHPLCRSTKMFVKKWPQKNKCGDTWWHRGEVFLFYIFRIHFLGGFFGPLELMVVFLFTPFQSYLLGILRKKAVRSSGTSNCPWNQK